MISAMKSVTASIRAKGISEPTYPIRISHIMSNENRLCRRFTRIRDPRKDLAERLDAILDIDGFATKDIDDGQPRRSVPTPLAPESKGGNMSLLAHARMTKVNHQVGVDMLGGDLVDAAAVGECVLSVKLPVAIQDVFSLAVRRVR